MAARRRSPMWTLTVMDGPLWGVFFALGGGLMLGGVLGVVVVAVFFPTGSYALQMGILVTASLVACGVALLGSAAWMKRHHPDRPARRG